jgi:hypothetical protein
MTQARRRETSRLTSHDAGRPPLGAPPRDLWQPVPRKHLRSFDPKHHASSSRPLVVAEGGFPSPPGCCLQGNARDTASRSAYAMPRESTLGRTGRQDDIPRQAPVKDFPRCAQRNGGHAVHSDTRRAREMPAQRGFPTNRQMARKFRAVDSEMAAKAAIACALAHHEQERTAAGLGRALINRHVRFKLKADMRADIREVHLGSYAEFTRNIHGRDDVSGAPWSLPVEWSLWDVLRPAGFLYWRLR